MQHWGKRARHETAELAVHQTFNTDFLNGVYPEKYHHRGKVSKLNSTHDNMIGPGGQWVGGLDNCEIFASVTVFVYSDQSGKVEIQFGADEQNVKTVYSQVYDGASSPSTWSWPVGARFCRIRFTNTSPEGQQDFKLQTLYGHQSITTDQNTWLGKTLSICPIPSATGDGRTLANTTYNEQLVACIRFKSEADASKRMELVELDGHLVANAAKVIIILRKLPDVSVIGGGAITFTGITNSAIEAYTPVGALNQRTIDGDPNLIGANNAPILGIAYINTAIIETKMHCDARLKWVNGASEILSVSALTYNNGAGPTIQTAFTWHEEI